MDIVEEEQKPVGDIHIAHSAVEIKGKQIEVRIKGLQLLFHASDNDMVGNASERLEGNHILHAAPVIGDDLGRKKPAFAELGIQGDNITGLFRFKYLKRLPMRLNFAIRSIASLYMKSYMNSGTDEPVTAV